MLDNLVLIIVIFMVIALFWMLFWVYARFKLSYWKRRGVEFLTPNLFFGNLKNAVFFRSPPSWHIGDLHKMAPPDAPFVGFYIFHKPCLLLRDLDIIKQIMIKDFDNFTDRYFAGSHQRDSMGMKNLFGIKNPAWKYVRSKIRPTLTRSKLKNMLPLMMEITEPMMKYINDQLTNQETVKVLDAQDIYYKYTTDLIASIALGTKIDSFYHPNEFTNAVYRSFHGLKRMITLVIVFFIPELLRVLGTRMFFNSYDYVKKIFWTAMENREKTGRKRGDFIDSLIQIKNGEQNPVYKFEGDNLVYQAATFFSGLESSSTCAAFTLMELAKHPEYQQLAREDINRAIEKHGWTFEAFQNMKYLEQTMLETLRLHPPVGTIDRCTLQDYKIPNSDVIIEKGTPIYISLFGFGVDPRFWDEPEVFNPDRFAEGNIPEAYMTFGTGHRMCIGMKLGQLHAKIILASLLRNYKVWQVKEHTSFLDRRSTVTTAGNGIYLHFKKI
ncbi:cytochrome P450 6k1 [Monomorium pharaonis]|uniref:cytochrome P450 6k1 n=1 Tax=Monomorium pharaonis TaxID=307658 RepID=UPI00063EFD3F|nr:cytochrome P450 6k1 [Monomorium pharaonis]